MRLRKISGVARQNRFVGLARRNRFVGLAIPIIIILTIIPFFPKGSFARGQENVTETTYYFLTDHLGSTDVVLDDQGNVVECADYLPFGSGRLRTAGTGSPETDYKFTGKELDDESGLYYYGARYYDSAIGRFISSDPLLLDEGSKPLASVLPNPQSLNRYSYVANNPVIMIDETGEYHKDVHYDLTLYLGMIAGLKYDQSKDVAHYDQWVDDNPQTMPFDVHHPYYSARNYFNKTTEYYHFATRKDAISRLDDALGDNSLEEFGTALHTFQDTYSHAGLTPETHSKLKDKPDLTYLNPAKANIMARSTFFQLRKLNLEINGSGDLAKDKYIKQSTEIWNSFKDEIYKSNSLSEDKKTGTKIETLGRITENKKE
jgi:RHS repeat-associated protein